MPLPGLTRTVTQTVAYRENDCIGFFIKDECTACFCLKILVIEEIRTLRVQTLSNTTKLIRKHNTNMVTILQSPSITLPFCIFVGLFTILTTAKSPTQAIIPRNALLNSTDSLSIRWQLECEAEYGTDLRLSSCQNLIKEHMGPIGSGTFAPRGDGLCTLEVFQTYDAILRENMMLLQGMAKRMLRCITDARHRGGIMTGLGLSRNLNFILSSYSPEITCLAPLPASPSVARAFTDIFTTMPASKDRKRFGTRLTPGPRELLPRGFKVPPSPGTPWTEAIAVTIEGATTEEASWWDIYRAASAVWAVCGSEGSGRGAGSGGIAKGVGECRHFFALFFLSPSLPSPRHTPSSSLKQLSLE
ncbi:MAG: hypothetical protein L6R37_006933 [Teloschistes peruensis]|nr:MAG: hypothetical protein L6R37_006933 [Teloschistes peruensis]